MKTKLRTALYSKELGKYDEYRHAEEFYFKGFRRVNDFIGIRFYEYLNIDCNDNNKAEEMLLCLYRFLYPDMETVDNSIHRCSMEQYFDFKGWKRNHANFKSVTLGDLLLPDSINRSALLILFDLLTKAFYKSDEYDSRHYKYSGLTEIREARKRTKLVERAEEETANGVSGKK